MWYARDIPTSNMYLKEHVVYGCVNSTRVGRICHSGIKASSTFPETNVWKLRSYSRNIHHLTSIQLSFHHPTETTLVEVIKDLQCCQFSGKFQNLHIIHSLSSMDHCSMLLPLKHLFIQPRRHLPGSSFSHSVFDFSSNRIGSSSSLILDDGRVHPSSSTMAY